MYISQVYTLTRFNHSRYQYNHHTFTIESISVVLFVFIFIYLTVPDLSCGMWDLWLGDVRSSPLTGNGTWAP